MLLLQTVSPSVPRLIHQGVQCRRHTATWHHQLTAQHKHVLKHVFAYLDVCN